MTTLADAIDYISRHRRLTDIVEDDMKGVMPLGEPRTYGCSYFVFEDLVEGDPVVAACQGGMLPYVRKTRDGEKAQATMGEDRPVNSTVQLDQDRKLRSDPW